MTNVTKNGYARSSTGDQNIDLQNDALKIAGCAEIYKDYASGKSTQARSELANCLQALRAGDTLTVWRLGRLGRSLSDLVMIVNALEKRGVVLESLSEQIDTSSASGKLIFHVFASMAEFERNVIRERPQAGLAAARARGRKGGRKPKLNDVGIRQIRAMLKDPAVKVMDIAKQYGVARTTIFNAVGAVKPERVTKAPVLVI
jgi:DNA invertase Pin-like site-specific DNA recombinase